MSLKSGSGRAIQTAPGAAADNALGKSLFATLECGFVDRRRSRTQVTARLGVFEFIEGWSNPHRRHSPLDHASPTPSPVSAVVGGG